VDGVDERLKSILLDVAEETKSEVIEMEIMPDHVIYLLNAIRNLESINS
jgi:putative transposase